MKTPILSRYLDTNGNGTGTKNANGDYSDVGLGLTEFYIEAQAGENLEVARMIVSAEDTGGMQAQEYGNLGAALTNGIEVKVLNEHDTVLMDLTDDIPVKTNAQWAQVCYDAQVLSWGSGDDLLVVRWTFAKTGQLIYLEEGQRLVVYLHDDLDGLLSHYFMVQG